MPEPSPALRPAVAIPLYKPTLTPAETLSLERTCEVLAGHARYLVGPAHLRPYLDGLCRHYGAGLGCKTYPDRYFAGIKGYNALMRSIDFYRSFNGHSHLLIAQTDALVISDALHAWCARGFSYVGAPWFEGGSQPRRPLAFMGVGNGGFSLRRLDDFVRVLATPRRIPNLAKSRAGGTQGLANLVRRIKHEYILAYNLEPFFPSSNEDFFWGLLVPAACPFFSVPRPQEALAFAFEAEPRQLYELNGHALPFGCHAWEKFDPAFWQEQLPFLAMQPVS